MIGQDPEAFDFKENYFQLPKEGHSLHYVEEGQGEVIVCLHGNPTWSYTFRRVVRDFKNSHRVIALDHLGCGKSSKPDDFSYRLENHIENLDLFIKGLNLKDITLVVHDWGGAIGIGWAVDHPHLVSKIVVMNSAAFLSKSIPPTIAICKVPFLGELLIRGLNIFLWGLFWFGTHKKLSAAIWSKYFAPYPSFASRKALARFVQDIPLFSRHPSYAKLKATQDKLGSLQMPMLFLWGMRDFCFHPGFLSRWQQYFSNARIVRFAEAGHLVHEDEPVKVAAELRGFISEHRDPYPQTC